MSITTAPITILDGLRPRLLDGYVGCLAEIMHLDRQADGSATMLANCRHDVSGRGFTFPDRYVVTRIGSERVSTRAKKQLLAWRNQRPVSNGH
ncbi:MAG: hypothetical protein ABSE73_01130 [Planctomycetota bacterium]